MGKAKVRPAHWKLGGNADTDFTSEFRLVKSLSHLGSGRNENGLADANAYGNATRTTAAETTRMMRPGPTSAAALLAHAPGRRGPGGGRLPTRSPSPTGPSSASPVTLQETARPVATATRASVAASRRPCASRTAPRMAAVLKVARNVSTVQKCESWIAIGLPARNAAAASAVRLPASRRAMR